MIDKEYEGIIRILLNKIKQLEWYIEELEDKPMSILRDPRPYSEISRLKKFMDVFNRETNNGAVEISKANLIANLVYDMFLAGEGEEFITKAMRNGQIYENRTGYYKKA